MSASDGTEQSQAYKVTLEGPGVTIDTEVDVGVAREIMNLVMGGTVQSGASGRRDKRRKSRAAGASSVEKKSKPRRKTTSAGVVKDLSLRPKGKVAFADLVKEKQPKTKEQRSTVSVYWLVHEADISSGITIDHVNTCYVDVGWPRPADFANSLAVTAKRKGWLDTSDLGDIKITTRGEDEVRYHLPPSSTKPKK
jgi:hypothetical protein